MKAVGVKALKNELSRYLRLVKGGELVLVLDRDEIVAEIRRPDRPRRAPHMSWSAFVAELAADGGIEPARSSEASMRAAVLAGEWPTVPNGAALIAEARADRE